jgi:hypothetical protein
MEWNKADRVISANKINHNVRVGQENILIETKYIRVREQGRELKKAIVPVPIAMYSFIQAVQFVGVDSCNCSRY